MCRSPACAETFRLAFCYFGDRSARRSFASDALRLAVDAVGFSIGSVLCMSSRVRSFGVSDFSAELLTSNFSSFIFLKHFNFLLL